MQCYIEASTGTKFYSKPEVLRYLGNKDCSPGSSREKDRGGGGHSYSKVCFIPHFIIVGLGPLLFLHISKVQTLEGCLNYPSEIYNLHLK